MGIKYDDKTRCIKCGCYNNITVKESIASNICEADTKCSECGHKDFWAYGFYKSPENESDLKQELAVHHVVMIGNEGVEGYVTVHDKKEITQGLFNAMELRARINSHRSIQGWTFTFPTKIPIDKITKELLVQLKAIKIF